MHRHPWHNLACSTTFSRRKIKTKIFTITIGFLAPLVLGNVYACIRVPSAPRAWPPKNLYNYNRVFSTAGPRMQAYAFPRSLSGASYHYTLNDFVLKSGMSASGSSPWRASGFRRYCAFMEFLRNVFILFKVEKHLSDSAVVIGVVMRI